MSSIRIVDLFSGCGGLSLGFGLCSEPGRAGPSFETILAADNWGPAVQCFNNNASRRDGATFPTARLTNLDWYVHPSEVLLFYLSHLAYAHPDVELQEALRALGLLDFLSGLLAIDRLFDKEVAPVGASARYKSDLAEVDSKVFSLALTKNTLKHLGLASLRRPSLARNELAWTAEYNALVEPSIQTCPKVNPADLSAHLCSSESDWDVFVAPLKETATATGRGQHQQNPQRVEGLARFLEGPNGRDLRSLWTNWRAKRIGVREDYCQRVSKPLRALYNESRRVHIMLGGPPCTGFSRIGRAVIRELRAQGAHAWPSDRFGDQRNALMLKYVLFLEALEPDAFLFENVANFRSRLKTRDGILDGSTLLEQIISDVSGDELKYHVSSTVLRCKNHGVPQARDRYILCGLRATKAKAELASQVLKIRTFGEEVPVLHAVLGLGAPAEFEFGVGGEKTSYRTPVFKLVDPRQPRAVVEYVNWIRQADPATGKEPLEADAHIFRTPRPDDAEFFKYVAPGIRWMDLTLKEGPTLRRAKENGMPEADRSLLLRLLFESISESLGSQHHLLQSGYLRNGSGTHGDWLERLSATKPSRTIVAHIGKDTYAYIHPLEPRPITMREAARIQSFPDYFSFAGVGIVDGYAMIGNAVPPLLARQLAASLLTAAGASLLFSPHNLPEAEMESPRPGAARSNQIPLDLPS